MKENPNAFRNGIPDDFKTVAISLAAVITHVGMFDFVPENLKTQEIYFEAIKRNGDILKKRLTNS